MALAFLLRVPGPVPGGMSDTTSVGRGDAVGNGAPTPAVGVAAGSEEAGDAVAADLLHLGLRLLVGLSGHDADSGDHVGLGELFGGLEIAPVGADRRVQGVGGEMGGKRVGKPSWAANWAPKRL